MSVMITLSNDLPIVASVAIDFLLTGIKNEIPGLLY